MQHVLLSVSVTLTCCCHALCAQPNFYEGTQEGGKTALEYVRCCFNRNWANFAKQLSCPCGNDDCCQLGQFSGPAWGHINVFPSTIRFYLE